MRRGPGRNDSCPCGSGRKFKRCCESGFSEEDQRSVFYKLGDIVRSRWGEGLQPLWGAYFGSEGTPESEQENDAFCDWLYFDARDVAGLRLVDRLLKSSELTQGERAYASMMRGTAMRLYAITSRFASPVVTLRDILSGNEFSLELDLTDLPDKNVLLAARILPRGASNLPELHGTNFLFPGELRDELTRCMREATEGLRPFHPHSDTSDIFKALAPLIHQRWSLVAHGPRSVAPLPDEKLREEAELRLQQQYETWAEDPHPLLEGLSPQAAAASGEHRPRLVSILSDLERAYERALALDEPAFDPSSLWTILGLREKDNGANCPSPPLGHETIASLIPGLDDLARNITRRYESGVVEDLESTISQSFIDRDPEFRDFFHDQIQQFVRRGTPLELTNLLMEEFAVHVGVRCNFELHLRKVFRVSEDLVWMLGGTSLEGIDALSLRLPFASFALLFTDRYALSLAERLLSRVQGCRLRGKLLRSLTAYVTEFRLPGRPRTVRVVFTCDALDGQRPVVVGLEFPMEPHTPLVDILASQGHGTDRAELSTIFACVPLRQLLHIVMNTILCVTNCKRELRTVVPAVPDDPAAGSRTPFDRRLTSETVHFLPGTIDISVLRAIQRARRGAVSGEQIHRCMVRGYYRRANPDWKDQEDRWIKPHWRGPKESSVVERRYRVKP